MPRFWSETQGHATSALPSAAAVPLPSSCGAAPGSAAAFLVTGTHYISLFHSLFHIVPAFEWFAERFAPAEHIVYAGRPGAERREKARVHVLPLITNRRGRPPYLLAEPFFNLSLLALGARGLTTPARELMLRPGRCLRFKTVAGGHCPFSFYARDAPARLARFRTAVARTLQLVPSATVPRRLLLVTRSAAGGGWSRGSSDRHVAGGWADTSPPRQITNKNLLRDAAAPFQAALRAFGYDVQVVDFGRLPIAAQFGLVTNSRVLLGNHGQGMAWSALLPTDRIRCGVVEIFARAAAEAPPTDYRDWSAANSAAYVPLLQATTPDCKGRPIRTCGHVVVDVGELTHAVVSLIQGLDAAGPPPQTVRT